MMTSSSMDQQVGELSVSKRKVSQALLISLGLGLVGLVLPILPHAFRQYTLQQKLSSLPQNLPDDARQKTQLEDQLFYTQSQWEVRIVLGGLALVLPTVALLVITIPSANNKLDATNKRTEEMFRSAGILATIVKIDYVHSEVKKIVDLSSDEQIYMTNLQNNQIQFLRERIKADYETFVHRLQRLQTKSMFVDGKHAVTFDKDLMAFARRQLLASAHVDQPADSFWVRQAGSEYWRINEETLGRWAQSGHGVPKLINNNSPGCGRLFILRQQTIEDIKTALNASEDNRTDEEQGLVTFVGCLRQQAAGGVDLRIAIEKEGKKSTPRALDVLIVDGWIVSKTTKHEVRDERQHRIEVIWKPIRVKEHVNDWWTAFTELGEPLRDVFPASIES